MSMFNRSLVCAAALAACALAPAVHAAVVYSLASSGQQLIRFDSASPGVVTNVGAITGAGSQGLSGLDFRPADGQLYGYSHQTGSVYTVDRNTGVATLASPWVRSTT